MKPSIPFDEQPPTAGWEDYVVNMPAPLEYTVNRIGDYTLMGMLAYKDSDGRYKLQDIRNRDITVHYNTCGLQPSALCRDIAWLYKHGAKHVALIEGSTPIERQMPTPPAGFIS